MDLFLHVGLVLSSHVKRYSKFIGKRKMELILQFGWGMIEHCRSLIESWHGGTVIMSPRDLSPAQLDRLANSINGLSGGHVLLDPQLYLPHSDHHRLLSHNFWPQNFDSQVFWTSPEMDIYIDRLIQRNHELGCSEFIVPGILAPQLSDDWLDVQNIIIDATLDMGCGLPTLGTVALSAEAVSNQDYVGDLLSRAESWGVDGYYCVFEHPRGLYLSDDPNWLTNALDIVAGLKMLGKKVIIGYCNQQFLSCCITKVDAIASGTWMNVRCFPPEKFRTSVDDVKQRSTWYYCPQSLSEYTMPYLDMAYRLSLLDMIAPADPFQNEFTHNLFRGQQPSSVGLSEKKSFRHYLHCLRAQVIDSVKSGYDETLQSHRTLLNSVQQLTNELYSQGIFGQSRDFKDIAFANLSAISAIDRTRGALLRRSWSTI